MLLYLHIPFCDSKCHYCAFNSYIDKHELKTAYMQALHRQLQHDLNTYLDKNDTIETLFIGGGTPSCVDAALYEPIFQTLWDYLAPDAEMSTEANPNSATPRWLRTMRSFGLNRISFGLQSFFDDKLKFLGRAHKSDTAIQAVERAYEIGFERLSIDLIYGTMLDTEVHMAQEIDQALSLPIEHLSAYELTIEEKTAFEHFPKAKKESLAQANLVRSLCQEAGLSPYEISNFGNPCRHNMGYWRYKPYLGIGSGAVGRVGERRLYPHTDIERYIAEPLQKEEEKLSQGDIIAEKLLLGFRSIVGVDSALLEEGMRERADLLVKEGKIEYEEGLYRNKEFLLADEITLFILD